jgi:hypothetical protein
MPLFNLTGDKEQDYVVDTPPSSVRILFLTGPVWRLPLDNLNIFELNWLARHPEDGPMAAREVGVTC